MEEPPRREDAKGLKQEVGGPFDGAQGGSRPVKVRVCVRLRISGDAEVGFHGRSEGRTLDWGKLRNGRQKSDKTKPIGDPLDRLRGDKGWRIFPVRVSGKRTVPQANQG
jgi:hypothetical protein